MQKISEEGTLLDLLALIFLSTISAYVIWSRTYLCTSTEEGIKSDFQSRFVYWGIVLGFILFAGLRSKYNDTTTYMYGFELIDANTIKLSTLLKPYGGFEIYQQLIKRYISDNPQVFIFVSSIVTNILYLKFYTRHTYKYCGMILLYAIGSFMFGMAGIKQAIAIAISLYAIENYLGKRYIRAVLLLFLAMTFHPYILCLICIPFLKNRLWDRKTIIIIAVCIIAFMNMERVFELFNIIGLDYSNEIFDNYTINPIRVLVEFVPVAISLIYRNKLNENGNEILILGMNMRIISFIFIAMGLFVNPIYFGRMSTYFTSLSAIAIPEMLSISWEENRNGRVYIFGYYVFFFIYFLMDMTKIGSISIFYDQFNHVPLSSLFAGKGV